MSDTPPPAFHIGEVAGVAATLVSGLRSAGWPAQAREMPAPGAAGGTVSKIVRIGPRVRAARDLRRELNGHDGIAHVHFATSGVLFLGSHPLVVHCHGSDVRNPRASTRPVLNAVMRSADLVIAATPDLMRWLPESAVYLPNPVDTAHFVPSTRQPDSDVLIFAALTDIKGASELLELGRKVMADRPGTTIYAIARGEWTDRFSAAGIELLPFVPTAALPELLARFRVVLGQRQLGVPGTSELQAMACGIPVVMPLRDDLGEVWSAPPVIGGDVSTASAAVVELLDDDVLRAEVGGAGMEWVLDNHSVGAVTDRLIQLYQGLGRGR